MILARLGCVLAVAAVGMLQQIGASRTALVTVSDARNRAIVDLGADDFVITERGQPREILDARVADYPIVVLIDTSREAQGQFADIQKAVLRFVERIGQRPVAIATLTDSPAPIATFDDDRERLTEQLKNATASSGTAFVAQAVSRAARTFLADAPRFSAIVIVAASPADATSDAVDTLAPPIVDSGAVVHTIVNRATAQTALAPGLELMRRLTDQTHGQFTAIYSPASFEVALNHLADRLAAEMMVEYMVPPGAPATDIQIGVRIPGARVRGLGVRPRS